MSFLGVSLINLCIYLKDSQLLSIVLANRYSTYVCSVDRPTMLHWFVYRALASPFVFFFSFDLAFCLLWCKLLLNGRECQKEAKDEKIRKQQQSTRS